MCVCVCVCTVACACAIHTLDARTCTTHARMPTHTYTHTLSLLPLSPTRSLSRAFLSHTHTCTLPHKPSLTRSRSYLSSFHPPGISPSLPFSLPPSLLPPSFLLSLHPLAFPPSSSPDPTQTFATEVFSQVASLTPLKDDVSILLRHLRRVKARILKSCCLLLQYLIQAVRVGGSAQKYSFYPGFIMMILKSTLLRKNNDL